MKLDKTQTQVNLARAFAGECQAGARYQFLATKAKQEKLCYMESLIKELAKNEMAHAKIYYDLMTEDMKNEMKNIELQGAYPFCKGSLLEEIKFSAHNEMEEHQKIYPAFAKVAKDEGLAEVAQKFEQIAMIENCHNMMLNEIATQLKDNKLYTKPNAVKWKCSHCGHEDTIKTAWQCCPVCGYGQGEVKIILPQ